MPKIPKAPEVPKIPLNERLFILRKNKWPPIGSLCDLYLEDYFEAIELLAAGPRCPLLTEGYKAKFRKYREGMDEQMDFIISMGKSISGATLRAQYLYDLLLLPIILLEDHL